MARLRRPLAAFLASGAGLLAELAWTRVAGLLFFGDAAYLVVSLAVGGLALGAGLGALRPRLLGRVASALAAAGAGGAIAAGTLAVLLLAGRGGVAAAMALATPGFLLLGLALAGLFARSAADAPRLYRADLLGGAAGAAASLPLLGTIGAPAAALVAAAAAIGAGAALAPPGRGALRRPLVLVAGATAALALLAPSPTVDPARLATPKPLVGELARGGRVVDGAWGTLGRSDLARRADGAEILYLDGGAGSLLPTAERADLWRGDLGRFPFETLAPERVFVVGGGGGLEVAHALETGAERIVAAEVNGAGARLARGRLADAAPPGTAPFADPRAEWRFDEARSVLRADGGAFDLVALSQAVTQTSEARRLALTENGLYTVEAFATWLERLAPGGAVALELYDELTLTRALVTAATALAEAGASEAEAMDHLLAVLDPGTAPPTPLLLVFREPLDPARAIDLARAAEAEGLALLHVPGLLENPPLDAVAAGVRDLASIVAAAEGVDLAPTRDDAPFFWSFEPGLPTPLRRLALVLGVASLLAIAATAVGARGGPVGARRGAALAGLLGVAFLAAELAVLSRAQLLLGHPAAALALTLGGLLAGGGIGSGLARRRPDAWPSTSRAALVGAAAVALWTLLWPAVAAAVGAAPAAVRAAAVLATVVPLGIALGAPFPLALRRIGGHGRVAVARAWALNGLGSLVGGAGATALAHLVGFGTVLMVATGLYLAVAALAASAGTARADDRSRAGPARSRAA